MKKALTLLCLTLFSLGLFSQTPQAIPFQGVARDTSGVLLQSQTIHLKITIHDSISTGPVVYQETQTVTTNALGLFTLSIGTGSSGIYSYSSINWGHNSKYVQLGFNLTGGLIYANLGTSQLQSVPFALYAFNSSGGTAQPSGQIAYGSGSSVISDGNFTRDTASQKTIITDSKGTQGITQIRVDSAKLFMTYYDYATGNSAGVFAGPSYSDWGLNSVCVADIVYDQYNQILYGFYAVADSSQMQTGGNIGGAIVGTKLYSAYLDVAMVENPNSPFNSLTLDTNGLHYEYNDTDRYSFPNADGRTNQVLTTNGSGILSWTNGGSPQPKGQVPYGNGAGSGIISDAGFTRDSATGTTSLSAHGLVAHSSLVTDSNKAIMSHTYANGNGYSIVSVNESSSGPQPRIQAVTLDSNNNEYGFVAGISPTGSYSEVAAQDASYNYALAGADTYSSYLDVGSNAGPYHPLCSLTVDTDGLHWEYKDTDRYDFPLYDGSANQVLTTNGSGSLIWSYPTTGGKAMFAPSSGDSIRTVYGSNIINPSSGISLLTIVLPASPTDNQTVYFTFTNTITTLSFTGGTIAGAGALSGISSVAAGNVKYWLTYDAGSSSWY